MDGVVRTRVGYTGGKQANPTYHDLGDHTESIQIDFDPTKLTYEKLLETYWQSHDPTSSSWSCQYKAAIWFANAEQEKVAKKTRDALEKKLGRKIETEVLPAVKFTLAEDYHQKYVLRGSREVAKELLAIYPDLKSFVDSTAAARLNGYLAGDGSLEQLEKELPSLGLSEAAQKAVLARCKGMKR